MFCTLNCVEFDFFFSVVKDVDLDYVAKVTHGFSGADLTDICQRVRVFVFIFSVVGTKSS